MNPTKLFSFLLIFTLAATLSITPAFSVPEQASSKAKDMVSVSIPENAKLIGPGVYDIGTKFQDGKIHQGTLFVFSDKQFAKPDGTPGNGNGKGGGGNGGEETSTCFSYITKGAKWRAEEPWNVSTVNAPPGIDVTGILINAVNQWENADTPANAIMSSLDPSIVVDVASIGNSMNDQNEVAFGDITEDGVIAATWVWRTTSGPPSQRYIAEWDQVFDVVSFSWSSTGATNAMDFDNIATHEVGHAVGMGHPESTCTLETMYAYASNGEIIKRDLYTGDIAGVNGLY
ncbi:MAG: matrixin family metalloprotease [Nitrosopumilus sp.]|nr:matrixin family metalloprotease [Nitrosopumilus sp.]